MKQIVAIGLLFVYLISFTEFSEILRLPLLFEHYTEHKSKVEDLSFLEFLVMHYKSDVAHDDTDMSLPFKDCNHSFSAQTNVLPVQKIVLTEKLEKTSLAFSCFYLIHEPQLLGGDIFQPPKI